MPADISSAANSVAVWVDLKLERLQKGLAQAGSLIKDRVKEWNKESRVPIPGVPGGFYAGASQINQQLDSIKSKFEPIKNSMGEMLSAANQMSLTAMRTILAGGAALIVAGFPIKEAAEFEKQMSLVKGITQATDAQYKELTDSAIKMARETVFSATQAAEAMTTLAKAGFSVYQIMTVLPSVMHLAAAGGVTVAQAADIAANTLHGFGLEAEAFAHVADVIAYSANFSNASIESMADSFKYVAPAARAAGMGIDETGAALGVLANAGIRGSMAGTTLRMILLRLGQDTGGFAEKLDELGVRAYDTSGNMRNFVDIMEDLHRADVDLGQIGGVFTARSAAGAVALSKEYDLLKRFTLENKSAAGEVKRLSDIVLNNFIGSVEYLKTSLQSLAIVFVSGLLGPMKGLIDVVSAFVNALARIGEIPGLGHILSLLVSVIVALTGAMGGLLLIMGGAGIMVSGFIRTMTFLAGAFTYLSGTVIKAQAAQTAYALAQAPLGRALLGLAAKVKALAISLTTMSATMMTWVAIIVMVGVAIAFLISQNEKALKSSIKLAESTTEARKSFDQYYDQLKETAVGTGEHDRILEELIKKYPELAGQLRYTNQSWEEQQMILDNFRTDLVQKELQAASNALVNLREELIRTKLIAETPIKGPILGGGETEPDSYQVLKMEKAALDANRRAQASARLMFDSWIRSINWDKLGREPLNMFKDSAEDVEDVLNENEESVLRIRDTIIKSGSSLEKVKEIWKLITKELQEQYQLELLKKGGLPLDKTIPGMAQFQEAKRQMDLAITYFNKQIGEKGMWKMAIDPESGRRVTAVVEDMISNMALAAGDFGPEVTQEMAKDLKKLVDDFKGFKSVTDDTLSKFIERARWMATQWNNYVANMKKIPMERMLPSLGGADWQEIGKRYNIAADKMDLISRTINTMIGKTKYVTQELAAAVVEFESAGDPFAVSKKGAMGLGQLMPGTAYDVYTKLGIPISKTRKEVMDLNKAFQEGRVSKDAYIKGMPQEFFEPVMNLAGSITYLDEQLAHFRGEVDQIPKGLAAYNAGLGNVKRGLSWEEVKKGLPKPGETIPYVDNIIRRLQQVSKQVGFQPFDEQTAKRAEDIAKSTGEIAVNLKETGKIPTPESLSREGAAIAKEWSERVAQAAARLEDVKKRKLDDLAVTQAEDNLSKVKEDREKALADFQLKAARQLAEIIAQDVQNKQKSYEVEVAAAEHLLSLKEAEVSAEKARLDAMMESGTISGAEVANRIVDMDNELYREQLALLDRKIVLAKMSAEEEERAIAARAGSQSQEETAYQYRQNEIKLEGTVLDILSQKKELTQKNVEAMHNWALEAARARKELIDIGFDQLTKLAWGPVQNRAAKLLENAKTYMELARKVGEIKVPSVTKEGGLIEPIKADPNFVSTVEELARAAAALGSPWAEPLRLIVEELKGAMTPERFKEIINEIQFKLIPEIKADAAFQIKWKEQIDDMVNAISDGVSDIIDGILEGGVDIKKSARNMFKGIFDAGIKKGLEKFEDLLIKGFEKLFKSVGGAVGSAIMTVIGLIGMMLLSSTSKSWSASGVESGVTSHEAVRGIIAGETTIPIGEIGESLQDALINTNGILRQIEENTRDLSGVAGGVASIEGSLEVKLSGAEFLAGLKEALTEFLTEYFAEALMTGT